MVTADDKYWVANLDDEATSRHDQPSFHVFAEGQHSDVRGQVYNLAAGASLALPHDGWPHHVFVILGVRGNLRARIAQAVVDVRPLSQVVVLPRIPCTLTAVTDASLELMSFLSRPPPSPDSAGAQPNPQRQTRLSTAGNVLVPAILTLESRSFTVTRDVSGINEIWRAQQANLELVGADPIELLALASLLESRGVDWQSSDQEIAETMRRFDLG